MAEADPHVQPSLATATEIKPKPKRRWGRIALMAIVPILLVVGALGYYFANDQYVTTDNAYVQQQKVSISADVGGRIVAVAVRENQSVNAGDLLFRIDPAPFRIAVAQADASIAAAQVKVSTLESDLGSKGSDIVAAQENLAFSQTEYRRQAELLQRGFTTRARLDTAGHSLAEARARLASARSDATMARAALATGAAAPGVNPGVLSGRVLREKAMLDLSRTEIRAPISGVVSQADRLQLGQSMVQGLPALTIVASGTSWVEANFKETDLAQMRIGQPATLSFDAYPDMKLKGHIASIGAGTGSEFSVLPAQNANGNWVKVTQRVPVRIAIAGKTARPLIAGLSAHVQIDISK